MGLIETVKDMLVPDTEPGIVYRCTACGETMEESRDHCPACGSPEIKEEEGFDMRPDT